MRRFLFRFQFIWTFSLVHHSSCWRVWLVTRLGSGWIGYHWSSANRRLCINLLPCVTIAIVLPGGKDPRK